MNKEEFEETAKRSAVPFIKKGMRIEMNGKSGIIKDFNRSANLDVLFDGDKKKSNCHPTWETVYFDKDNNIIVDFRNIKNAN